MTPADRDRARLPRQYPLGHILLEVVDRPLLVAVEPVLVRGR